MPAWADRSGCAGQLFGGFRPLFALCMALALSGPAAAQTEAFDLVSKTQFRVCADPANMPFSNKDGQGFENKLAELFAEKLGRELTYTWFPQATGFVRQTLRAGKCDVIMGYAQGHELVLNTNHYYVSSYVLITPPGSDLMDVDALSDPRLQGRRLGVVAGSPPATHLARNGLIGKSRPYPLMVDRRHESPAERMIEDLAAGEIDAAILWGPIGGWFAKELGADVHIVPLLREETAPRMFFRVTLGIRQGELAWKRELNSLIRRNQAEIDMILASYGVPIVETFGRAEGTE